MRDPIPKDKAESDSGGDLCSTSGLHKHVYIHGHVPAPTHEYTIIHILHAKLKQHIKSNTEREA